MTSLMASAAAFADPTSTPLRLRATDMSLDTTMWGGTSIYTGLASQMSYALGWQEEYIMLSADVVLEYERRLVALRRELVHYKRLVADLLGSKQALDEYGEIRPVIPMDQQSADLITSIVKAQIASSATFRDFEEEEL